MLKYNPNNLNLTIELYDKFNIDRCEKQNNIIIERKESFQKKYPLLNFDDLELLNLTCCPHNGNNAYYKHKTFNRYFAFSDDYNCNDVTKCYEWNKIMNVNSFVYF